MRRWSDIDVDVSDREIQNQQQLLMLTQNKVQSNGDSLRPEAKALFPGLSFHLLRKEAVA